MSKWIKKDDKVVVITGNEKGRMGQVLSRAGEYVKIQGLNIRKKHAKRKTKASGGDILEVEMPIHVSNVMICSAEGKPVKLKVRLSKNMEKELFYVENGKDVLHRQLHKT